MPILRRWMQKVHLDQKFKVALSVRWPEINETLLIETPKAKAKPRKQIKGKWGAWLESHCM